jgi:hypothetical protein
MALSRPAFEVQALKCLQTCRDLAPIARDAGCRRGPESSEDLQLAAAMHPVTFRETHSSRLQSRKLQVKTKVPDAHVIHPSQRHGTIAFSRRSISSGTVVFAAAASHAHVSNSDPMIAHDNRYLAASLRRLFVLACSSTATALLPWIARTRLPFCIHPSVHRGVP